MKNITPHPAVKVTIETLHAHRIQVLKRLAVATENGNRPLVQALWHMAEATKNKIIHLETNEKN